MTNKNENKVALKPTQPSSVRGEKLRKAYEKYHEYTGISQRELARISGVGTPSNLLQLMHGRRPIGLAPALKLSRTMKMPINEILEDDSLHLLVDCYSALNPEALKRMGKGYRVDVYKPKEALKQIESATGNPSRETYASYEAGRKLIGLEVRGDELSPLLNKGDIAIVDLEMQPKPKDIVFACIKGQEEPLLRKYTVIDVDEDGKDIFTLRTCDEAYLQFSSNRFEIKILGVVIERKCFLRED